MSVLVTGFGPFLEVGENPSGRIAEVLAGRSVAGEPVVARVLPTSFAGAREAIARLVATHAPVAALALGVARRRDGYQLERRARGVVTSTSCDVDGASWAGRALDGGACETRWPLTAIAEELAREGYALTTSDDAGGYVCDATYQALMVAAARVARPTPVAFLHVPDRRDAASVAAGARLATAILEKLARQAMVPPAC